VTATFSYTLISSPSLTLPSLNWLKNTNLNYIALLPDICLLITILMHFEMERPVYVVMLPVIVMTLCDLLGIYQHFKLTYCLFVQ